ncbi:MAG: sulfotransferase [Candidatus Palauibacterales bacterium]|nr:sulfotransferase [Candidatus Palauibacterales bacterium]MDP2483862.1 sulfotransferase [Candidatus Palauibacterales bacterium]
MSRLSVIYIGGYGRSGSTILGTLLGALPEALHAGELSCLPAEWPDRTRRCSCGTVLCECPAWSDCDPGRLLSAAEWTTIRRLEALSSLPRLLLGWTSRKDREAIRHYGSVVLSALAANADCAMIIDSSKTARAAASRPAALARYSEARVVLVHLTRDGRRCLHSLLMTGSNWKLEGRAEAVQPGALRASLGWLMANLAASVSGLFLFRGRYCRLRFEDLLEDPEGTLIHLERCTGVDLSAIRERLGRQEGFPVGHVLGGNRLRFEQEVRLRPERAQADTDLSRSQRVTFAVVAGWLNRLYGYGG